MAQSAISAAGLAQLVAWIKSATYTDVYAFSLLVTVQMTRLALSHDGTKAVATDANPGNWNVDVGSINDWMLATATTDTAACAQIVQIEATVAARLAI